MSTNLTYLAGVAIAAGLTVYGAVQVLKAREKDESPTDVTSRQLRGFFYLILASALLAFVQNLAVGGFSLADLIYSTRP
jgi:hypothetical protein